MPVTAYPALILFALIASCNWLFLRKGHSLTPLVGPILLLLGSIKWAEPWYYWLLLLLDPGSITTLLDLPDILKLIWDGSFVNTPYGSTATAASSWHTSPAKPNWRTAKGKSTAAAAVIGGAKRINCTSSTAAPP